VHILRFIPFGGRGVVKVYAGEFPALDGTEALVETLVYAAGARVGLFFTLQVVGAYPPARDPVRDKRAGQRPAQVAQSPDAGAEGRAQVRRTAGGYQVRRLGRRAGDRFGSVEPGAEKLFSVRSDIVYVVIIHHSVFNL
jgi:hypothetical protein